MPLCEGAVAFLHDGFEGFSVENVDVGVSHGVEDVEDDLSGDRRAAVLHIHFGHLVLLLSVGNGMTSPAGGQVSGWTRPPPPSEGRVGLVVAQR